VVLITWDEANAFCDWLSRKTHSLIRLPSEAEWEYACRAGDMNEYPDNPDEVAWYGANSPTYTHPVALKRPNAWGLYDMLGNVWEMCLDRVNTGYVGAPTDGSPWLTSNIRHTVASNERRVRGGAYNRQRWTLMYGHRYFTPGRSTNYGFRIVRLPAEKRLNNNG
jgi:formylglycine-generating enzyme required for sulfatase activity